jgi:hypothetical protein
LPKSHRLCNRSRRYFSVLSSLLFVIFTRLIWLIDLKDMFSIWLLRRQASLLHCADEGSWSLTLLDFECGWNSESKDTTNSLQKTKNRYVQEIIIAFYHLFSASFFGNAFNLNIVFQVTRVEQVHFYSTRVIV